MLLQINYEAYYWQIWISIFLTVALFAWLLYLTVVSYLKKGAKEFEDAPKQPIKTDCCKDAQCYIVNDGIKIKTFTTPNGALIYSTAFFNKHGRYPKIYFCENEVKTELTANCLRRIINTNNAFRYIE